MAKFELFNADDFLEIEIKFCFNSNISDVSKFYHAEVAKIANGKHQKWLDQQPVVYGHHMTSTNQWIYGTELNPPDAETPDTHSARLVDIQEIKPKECDHIAEGYRVDMRGFMESKCSKCGVNLKAKWEPCEEPAIKSSAQLDAEDQRGIKR